MLLGCRVAHPHQAGANSIRPDEIARYPAWPYHANRNLSSQAIKNDSRRRRGTTCARSCHHLGSLASPEQILGQFYIFRRESPAERPPFRTQRLCLTARRGRSIYTLEHRYSLALRRTTSSWPVFNMDDPSATRLTLYRLGGSLSPPSTQRFQRSE